MENNKARKLAEIIVRVRLKEVSEQDRIFLNEWLDESEKNRAMYLRIVRGECIAHRLREEENVSRSVDYLQVKRAVIRLLKRKHRRKIYIGFGMTAACIVGIIFCVIFGESEKAKEVDQESKEQVLVATASKIEDETVLVLADGSKVNLIKPESERIQQENMLIVREEGRLIYQNQEKSIVLKEAINKVITGKKPFALSLSDGTRVWLNSETELEFPVDFVKDERVVTLRGEAYFEVARDIYKPFIVKTKKIDTRVLGTSFNIKAYDDELEARATLISGKVAVQLAGRDTMAYTTLFPGMQARRKMNQDEISVRKVDVEEVLAWRNNNFIFTDEDMTVVLHVLARWYGVNFIQEGQCRNYTFSGMVTRNERLLNVLEMLTLAGGPHFEIKENNVYIREK